MRGAPNTPNLHVWSAKTGSPQADWNVPNGGVHNLAFTDDDSTLLVMSGAGTVSRWNIETQQKSGEFATASSRSRSLKSAAFSPDGQLIATCTSGDSRLIVWDTVDGKEVRSLSLDGGRGGMTLFSPDGSILAASSIRSPDDQNSSYDYVIHYWDVSTGECLGEMHRDGAAVTSLAFSPDGTQLFSGLTNGTVLVRDPDGLQRLALR